MLAVILALSLQEQPAEKPAVQPLPQKLTYEPYKGLSVGFRIVAPDGEFLDQDEVGGTEGLDWDDVFNTGYGFEFEYEHLWRTSKVFAVGVYFGTAFDFFQGEEKTITDGVDTLTLEHDRLTTIRFMVGARFRETFGKFFLDQSVGFGAMSYSSVDVEISDGIDSVTVGAIDSTVVFAFELNLRAGFILSEHSSIWLGFGWEANGNPDVASDLDDGSDYGAQSNGLFTLGATFDF